MVQMTDFFKSNGLDHIPLIWKTYSNLKIRRKDDRTDNWVKECVEKIKEKYSDAQWKNALMFRGYIQLHDRHTDKKGILSSSEAMIDFILRKGSVPRINTFVDIYNTISALTGVSIGAHDTGNFVGTPRLEVLDKDYRFKIIGGRGEDLAKKGEYCYMDDEGILCRMDIKQSDRTKITESTTDVLVFFQGHESLGEDELKKAVDLLESVHP